MVSNQTLQDHISQLSELGDDARLWIFQSSKEITLENQEIIQNHLIRFLSTWNSHSKSLLAKCLIAYDRFIIIALDEQVSSSASGCSIDSMTQQIQGLSDHLNINLLDRTTFFLLIEDAVKGIAMHDLKDAVHRGEVDKKSLVFNNLIKTKGEMTHQWIIPLEESWHKRFV